VGRPEELPDEPVRDGVQARTDPCCARKNPDVEIQIGTRRIPVHARPVLPGDDGRDRYWKIVNDNNRNRYRAYQKATSRPIPIIALTPR
jgi:hypothetical protein